ncbi:MAG TPA: N-acetyl sugar amidotransferase [Kofleriaceae bacterium]|nr:N-acetyl sugar amidotransferase [Kofleriaceae bacterium]
MTVPERRTCVRCIMDTSDPDIVFDARGVCHHCHAYDESVRTRVMTTDPSKRDALVAEIKRAGEGKPYDCIIGVSGGVDSTYVAYATRKLLGLRPLAVHLDNGWDSELAVKNIQNVLEKLDIELYTDVLDWDEFRDLQLAFLRASTPDSEIPSDHAIVSVLYQQARRLGVRYILSGCNVRTESHLPPSWSRGHSDWRYIQALHAQFGTRPLKTFPHRHALNLVWDARTVHWVDILNYLDYRKADALRVLQDELGWQYYGGKHYESIYTRFYQGYILPRKFGFDKRRMHLSSLICSGEITREQALAELEQPPYPEELQAADREYVAKKLGITDSELEQILRAPPKRFEDYPSYENSRAIRLARRVRALLPFK